MNVSLAILAALLIIPLPAIAADRCSAASRTWTVTRDDLRELELSWNDAATNRDTATKIDLTTFDLEQRNGQRVPIEVKEAWIEAKHENVMRLLSSLGLERPSETELAEIGITKDFISAQRMEAIPYGKRKRMSETRMHLGVLVDELEPACTKGGDGAVFVGVFTMGAVENSSLDWGGTMISIQGFGSCALHSLGMRQYAINIKKSVENLLCKSTPEGVMP